MKQAKYSESILDNNEWCFNCGSTQYIQRHEVFFGRNRQNSKKYGCWVHLCSKCHDIVHFGKDKTLKENLQKICREKFIELYGEEKFNEIFK